MSEGDRPRAVISIPGMGAGRIVLVWAPGAASFVVVETATNGTLDAQVGSIVALSAGGASPMYYQVTGAGLEEIRDAGARDM